MIVYDKLYLKIIQQVSEETGIPKDVVLVAYRSLWEFIKEHIEDLNIKSVDSEEEFNDLRVSFNIPSMGKLYSTWDKVSRIRRRINYLKNIKKDETKKD